MSFNLLLNVRNNNEFCTPSNNKRLTDVRTERRINTELPFWISFHSMNILHRMDGYIRAYLWSVCFFFPLIQLLLLLLPLLLLILLWCHLFYPCIFNRISIWIILYLKSAVCIRAHIMERKRPLIDSNWRIVQSWQTHLKDWAGLINCVIQFKLKLIGMKYSIANSKYKWFVLRLMISMCEILMNNSKEIESASE